MSRIRFANIPTPTLPPAGRIFLYFDETDSHAKTIDSSGAVFDLTLSGTGGGEGTISDAIIGGVGITVTSGTSITTIDGHLRYSAAENPAIMAGSNVTVVSGANTITISSTGGGGDVPNALVGADGITVTSGVSEDTITGFRDEFVAASGFLSVAVENLPSIQIRRTTDLALSISFVDLTFDVTDLENDNTVLEHDVVNTDRIKIKEAGLYLVQYNFAVASTVLGQPTARVRINDTTVIPGSEMANEDANDENHIGNDFLCNCVVDDFLTLQVKQTAGTHTIKRDTVLNVIKLRGSKGDKGDAGTPGTPGSGSTINVSKDDVLTASGIGNLNFEGNVDVVDEGGGKATVTISGTGGGAFPPNWINKGRVSFVSVTQASIGETGITSSARDSSDTFNISWSGVLTAAITTAGAGGLDTGSEAADTWYAVHAIADSTEVNAVDALLSTSDTTPTLPAGYDKFRRLGWVRNDASSNFIRFQQTGAGTDKTYMLDVAADLVALNNGTATTFTAVSLAPFAPPTSRWAWCRFDFDNVGAASDDFAIRPSDFVNATKNTAPTVLQLGVGTSGQEHREHRWTLTDGNQSIDYIKQNTGSTLDIIVTGYRDEI